MYCKVLYCRFPHKHTTRGHKCGKCNKFGHGQVECGNKKMILKLNNYFNDVLPIDKQCTFIDCKHKHNHTSDSHLCSLCGERHFDNTCNIKKFECPICRTDGDAKNIFEVKGNDDTCKICLDNNAEVYFPNCKHICCCKKCFDQICV